MTATAPGSPGLATAPRSLESYLTSRARGDLATRIRAVEAEIDARGSL